MSAKRENGSASPSVQKWVIDSDVEKELRSGALKDSLADETLSYGFIELSLRCYNLTAIGWDGIEPLSWCPSLLRVDLSGCPKLESIPRLTFGSCHHLVTVVFGEHRNITNIEGAAFMDCSALTSINLPSKLKIIEYMTFGVCTSFERIVCNKNLNTIFKGAFSGCSKLEDVQLASSLTSLGFPSFGGCDRLIELAATAGFPSNEVGARDDTGEKINLGARVVPYLIGRFERSEKKDIVLVAHMRFKNAVHEGEGDEKEKVAAAKQLIHPTTQKKRIQNCSQCGKSKMKLLSYSKCKSAHYCNEKCQRKAFKEHKKVCNQGKTDYSENKILVGDLLSVAMRERDVEGVLGTMLSYV